MSTSSFPSHSLPEDEHNEQYPIYEEVPELPADEHVDEQVQVDEPLATEEQATTGDVPTLPPSVETELPAEAQGETNGGPLGCCLGVTVGIMLSLFLGVIGFGHVAANVLVFVIHADTITNIRIATASFAVIGAFLGGYCGWRIGKRIYREYELSPGQKRRLAQLERKYKR